MISHEHKCIFIHIPKCAGTSIETVLGHHDDLGLPINQDHRTLRMVEMPFPNLGMFSSMENAAQVFRRAHHALSRNIHDKNKFTVTTRQYDSYFKFSFVRNPWSRAFSWHQNVMRDEIHLRRLGISPNLSLNEFLFRFAGKGALRPQTYWLRDFRGSMSSLFIGRFENLQSDFDRCCERMGIPPIALPHILKGPDIRYTEAYDDESRGLVAKLYEDEIELFGYRFGE